MASSAMFKCPLCEKIFGNRKKLRSHTFSHTLEKPHKCPTCSTAFGLIVNLKEHIRTLHDGGVANFSCPKCDYKCNRRHILENHSRKHSSERPFSCTEPGCSFNTKYPTALASHVRFVHKNIRPFKCKYNGCSYKAISSCHLEDHMKTHSNERHFSCTFPGCSQTFKRQADLKRHISVIHNEEKPFKCSTCQFETKYKTVLRQHENKHMDTPRFQCQVPNCKYASNQKQGIQLHFDSKHRKKDVLCTHSGCTYKCGSIARLKIHARYHKRPIFMCPQNPCNFSTRNPKILNKHLSCRHGDDQSVSLVLPQHSRIMTSAQAVERKTIFCPMSNCDYQTDFPHLYDYHKRTHDKDKLNYACKFCSMRFPRPYLLETHIQRHTGEKPYSCSHCDYTTVSTSQLRYHAGHLHGIDLVPSEEKKEVNVCNLCKTICMSYNEFVLHSMKHLQVVVVLERLRVIVQ